MKPPPEGDRRLSIIAGVRTPCIALTGGIQFVSLPRTRRVAIGITVPTVIVILILITVYLRLIG